jgi:hypothetical protein
MEIPAMYLLMGIFETHHMVSIYSREAKLDNKSAQYRWINDHEVEILLDNGSRIRHLTVTQNLILLRNK